MVVREMMSRHMPVELMGIGMMEEMIADIRRKWKGELRMAHDLMHIDL